MRLLNVLPRVTVQGGEKNPPTCFPPSDAELSAAFRSAPWHISGKQHFPLSPSGTLTPHWQMCAVFGQSFTELSLSVWGCAQMTEMMQRRLSLRVDTRCSFRWRDSQHLTVKAWLFQSDLILVHMVLQAEVRGEVAMVVAPLSLEPLSGLGCDGWPEEDPEIQVAACFSSVQSSEKEKKIHVTKLYPCSYQWVGTISKTVFLNYVYHHYIPERGTYYALTLCDIFFFNLNKLGTPLACYPGGIKESRALISPNTSAEVPAS